MPAARWLAAALLTCLALLTTAALPAAAEAAPASVTAAATATPGAAATDTAPDPAPDPAPGRAADPAGTTDEGGRVPTFVLLAFGAVVVVALGLAATFLHQYRRSDPPRR